MIEAPPPMSLPSPTTTPCEMRPSTIDVPSVPALKLTKPSCITVVPGARWAPRRTRSASATRTPVGSWAWGPGSERVAGAMANTNTFRVLRDSAGLQPFCLRPPLEEPAPQPPKWAAAPGDVVRIEYTDRIEPQDWQPLGTVTAATPYVAIDDTNAWPQAQRYYRAVAVP